MDQATETRQRLAGGWPHVSTRVVVWLSGAQEIVTNVVGVGAPGARLTVSWSCVQVSFTAADQVALMASELRDLTGVTAVLPPVSDPRRIHGDAEQFGPLPAALVTFVEPKRVEAIPGRRDVRGGGQPMRWVDLSTGYLLLRVVDRHGMDSLTAHLNRAETLAAAALPATSHGRRVPVS